MLLERFVADQEISISHGPLHRYPDVFDLCRALRVKCTQEQRSAYFANVKPDRPSNGIFWVISESARHRHHLVLSKTHHANTKVARKVFESIRSTISDRFRGTDYPRR